MAHTLEPEWHEAFQARILQVALDHCKERFEAPTWLAFTRVWLDHQPANLVASELRQPIDWVYVAKSRVLKALRHAVLQLADEWPFENDKDKV